ncbi:MAG: hypothetical protein K2X11_07020 [Acetobacteraceae bacterium]|nr:hypothetical protein [Acetobacteraceae bacterium]
MVPLPDEASSRHRTRPALPAAAPDGHIHDHRTVAFRAAALVAAMSGFGRSRFGVPAAPLHSAEPLPDRQAVRFRFGPDGTAGEVVLAGDSLAALIIGYCSGARIPLPRRAAKHMAITSDGVRFDFSMTYADAPPFVSRAVGRRPRA